MRLRADHRQHGPTNESVGVCVDEEHSCGLGDEVGNDQFEWMAINGCESIRGREPELAKFEQDKKFTAS